MSKIKQMRLEHYHTTSIIMHDIDPKTHKLAHIPL